MEPAVEQLGSLPRSCVDNPSNPWNSDDVMPDAPAPVLLTGATGFVGRHVAVALQAAGFEVRAASRDPQASRRHSPELDWVRCDLTEPAQVRQALEGTRAAIYLYHGLGSGPAYDRREASCASTFRQMAEAAGVERIAYLGGIRPHGPASRHLSSRLETGRILRDGRIPTVELRAAMVIGHSSQSFALVRDIAFRLPMVALPPWLDRRSCPVSITDVAAALALALRVPLEHSAWFELPGPDCLSHRELVDRLCSAVGARLLEPRLPLTPRLASTLLAAISRVRGAVTRELVEGLMHDLLPEGPSFWSLFGTPTLRSVPEAIADALADELSPVSPSVESRRRIWATTRSWLGALEAGHGF